MRLTEATVRKAYALLEERDAITEKYRRVFGNGQSNGKTSHRTVAGKRVSARAAITPKQRKARQLQGRYMAAIRNLGVQGKRYISKVREKSGMPAAIAAAKKLSAEA